MSETEKALAVPIAADICHHLMSEYGEPSHHDNTHGQARFEVADLDGRELTALLIQKGIGPSAVYKFYLDDVLDRSMDSVYTIQSGTGVTQHLKSRGQILATYNWPANVGSDLLYACYGRRVD